MARTCDDCPAKGSIKVPGYGSREPGILFVGESPGAYEVKEGRPFSPNGASGKFLHQVLLDLGEDPNEHYYDNVVMCPCTGKPPASKLNVCIDGLYDRIEELQPKLIVPMGNTAAKSVALFGRGISRIRSHYRELELDNGRYGVLPTYHPAAILRSPDLFRDFSKDIQRAIRIVNGEPAVIAPPYENYELVQEIEEFAGIFDKWWDAKMLAIDLETAGVFSDEDPILCIGVGYGRGRASSVNWDIFKDTGLHRELAELLETKPIAFQHGMFDLAYLWAQEIDPNFAYDTEIAHWLLDERASGHGLEAMAMEYYSAPPYKSMFRTRHGLGTFIKDEEESGRRWSAVPRRDLLAYNAADADYTWRLAVDTRKELREQGMLELQKLIVRCTVLYTDLYVDGITIDMEKLDELEDKLTRERDEAEAVLRKYAPDVNPRSPQQLARYFYDELELTTFGDIDTSVRKEIPMEVLSAEIKTVDDEEAQLFWKTSRPALFGGTGSIEKQEGLSSRSTGMFALYWLAQQHEYPRALIQYKKAQKRLKTYVGQVRDNLWPDGVVRPTYKVVGHLHGRFGSSKPVIHNLPNEHEIYDLYRAPEGYAIVYADYSQADMRMLAHIADDENLRQWLKGDPHAEAVKVIRDLTDKELEKIKKERPDEYKRSRLAGKAVNFGMFYGRGAESLAPQLGVSVEEARGWMKRYWQRIPAVKQWMDGRMEELMAHQEFTSPFGNKRRFPLLISRAHVSKAAKLGVNFPIMSSVNYLTALAHISVVDTLREAGIDTFVYPHIHDSINIAVPIENLAEAAELVKRTMAEVPHKWGFNSIDWPVDIEVGTHWGSRDAVENSPLIRR